MGGSLDELVDEMQLKNTLVYVIDQVASHYQKFLSHKPEKHGESPYLIQARKFWQLYQRDGAANEVTQTFRKSLAEQVSSVEIPRPSCIWYWMIGGGLVGSTAGGTLALESPVLLFSGLGVFLFGMAGCFIQDKICGEERNNYVKIIKEAPDSVFNAALSEVYKKNNAFSS